MAQTPCYRQSATSSAAAAVEGKIPSYLLISPVGCRNQTPRYIQYCSDCSSEKSFAAAAEFADKDKVGQKVIIF